MKGGVQLLPLFLRPQTKQIMIINILFGSIAALFVFYGLDYAVTLYRLHRTRSRDQQQRRKRYLTTITQTNPKSHEHN